MKRILINAIQPEELRVAIVHGQHLYDLDIEVGSHNQRKANIYKGQVNRIEPSLEAAFIDYGAARHGFLPFKEIAHQYFADKKTADGKPLSIKEALKEGQEFEVQIEKEARGTKGASLTTFLSFAGRYMVLMPNNPRAGGISRRVEGKNRTELRKVLSTLDIPEGMGVIVRTVGVGRTAEELQSDLDYLLRLCNATHQAALERKSPFLIYQESNVIIRAIRDYFSHDITEILIDEDTVYKQAYDFISQVMPEYIPRVKRYVGDTPLFSHFQIESQIESAFSHTVKLPSGSSLVIDHTEALVAIDINSARATKGADIEETALNTNLEAVDEIARQLRIRDIGGLIVIDFIDMSPPRNRHEVENRLQNALQPDRARIQVGRISRFGLLEMSRQRLRPSLEDSSLSVCATCRGHGYLRGPTSLALAILRLIEEQALKDKTKYVVNRLPSKVATFLLNEKRDRVVEIERRTNVRIILIPDPQMDYPSYSIERIRDDDYTHDAMSKLSYALTLKPESGSEIEFSVPSPVEKPAVKVVPLPACTPQRTVPGSNKGKIASSEGLLQRLWSNLFGSRYKLEEGTLTDGQQPRKQNPDYHRGHQQPAPGDAPDDRKTSATTGSKTTGRSKGVAKAAPKPPNTDKDSIHQGQRQHPRTSYLRGNRREGTSGRSPNNSKPSNEAKVVATDTNNPDAEPSDRHSETQPAMATKKKSDSKPKPSSPRPSAQSQPATTETANAANLTATSTAEATTPDPKPVRKRPEQRRRRRIPRSAQSNSEGGEKSVAAVAKPQTKPDSDDE